MLPRDAAGRVAVELRVRGVVQGVGFRPFAFRLANKLNLAGWVRNDSHGATVHIEGRAADVLAFHDGLIADIPAPACLEAVEVVPAAPTSATGFRIEPSRAETSIAARVPPDRATCEPCRCEVFDPKNRRFRHPFANCTVCGPRFTIVDALPYDRARTAMNRFALCPACAAEFSDPTDRRFHAQPVACPFCGPVIVTRTAAGDTGVGDAALALAVGVLRSGGILALKGLGGFQLLVRADDPAAVRRLRVLKRRPSKPLAVMVSSVADARRLAQIDDTEQRQLTDPANPIVLLDRLPTAPLANEVSPSIGTVGIVLPTTPLHHLLLGDLDFPVVATSGNASGEPIALDGAEAADQLGAIADGFLDHDRPIRRRADDSVVRIIAGRPMVIRLARGYAPLPLPHLERWAAARNLPCALAVGGQQKVALALWTGTQAVLGPYIGDLDDHRTQAAFQIATEDFTTLYDCRPAVVACDHHPDYATTRWAECSGAEVFRVQHHHAHAVGLMVEHDLLDREVLAFTWDGTGLGDDGTLWGGEVLRVTLTGYTRVASLWPIPLPGGEAAIHEPARIALAIVAAACGVERCLTDRQLLERLGLSESAARTLLRMVDREINCPTSTGMGRLFDGLAALVLPLPRVSYEAEAAVRLESICTDSSVIPYPISTVFRDGIWRGDWRPLVDAVLNDLCDGVAVGVIAARIHAAVALWADDVADRYRGLPVVLAGGCFQNRRLTQSLRTRLEAAGRIVHQPEQIPGNDGGLAVGQLAVTLARLAGTRISPPRGDTECV